MQEEDRPFRKSTTQGFRPLDAPSNSKAIESELSEALKRLEHRVEIFVSISREQWISGHCELAEAYRKQAAESKAYAQWIRRLLDLGREEVG